MSTLPALPPLAQAIAGSVGAAVSNATVYPLDLVTTRIQTAPRSNKSYNSLLSALKTILRNEGIAAFYAGIVPDTLSTALSNFLYFFAYGYLRVLLIKRKSPATSKADYAKIKFSAQEELGIGMLAGLISRFVTTPLANVTVRKQTAKKKSDTGEKTLKPTIENDSDEDDEAFHPVSSVEILKEIYKEGGIAGFWTGFQSAVLLTTNPAITYYLFELFKKVLIPVQYRSKPRPSQTFITGAFASAIASAIVYPLILSKTRLQYRGPSGKRLYSSMPEVFTKTIQKHGLLGMYKGLEAQLYKGFLDSGITMLIKQRTEIGIVNFYRAVKSSQ